MDNAPLSDYDGGVSADYDAGALDVYAGGAPNDGLGGANGLADDAGLIGGDQNLAMLEKAVPGIPGEDYPIYASVPETAFVCDGQVEGGKQHAHKLIDAIKSQNLAHFRLLC